MKPVLLSVLTLSFAASVGASQSLTIPVVSPVAPQDAYRFAIALVEGISAYVNATDDLGNLAPTGQPLNDFITQLAAERIAAAKWRQAQTSVSPFAFSEDEAVAIVARFLARTYGAMSDLYGRDVALAEAALNHTLSPADVLIERSKIQSLQDRAFAFLVIGTANTTNALTDRSRTDAQGHVAYLKMTTEQRNEVIRRLGIVVGHSPDNEALDASREVHDMPAVAIWRWLQEGRGSDAR